MEIMHSVDVTNFGIFQLIKEKNKCVNQELVTTILAVTIQWQHARHKNDIDAEEA
jgi:hypothetical protein